MAAPAVAQKAGLSTPEGERDYYVWTPAGYTGRTPVPLVLDLHGSGQAALDYATNVSRIAQEGSQRGYLVVAPQGLGRIWHPPGYGTVPDDVAFVRQLVGSLASTYCVDATRIYATGISIGAGMTTYLSCTLDIWAAVAPLSGVNLAPPCPTAPAVPVLAFHGTNDLVIPFTAAPDANGPPQDGVPYQGDVATVMDRWATRNGCGTARIDVVDPPTVTTRRYEGCRPGEDVVLSIEQGKGHAYPGGPPISARERAIAGGQSDAVDASKLILDFFDAHHRVAAAALSGTGAGAPASPSAAPLTTVTASPSAGA